MNEPKTVKVPGENEPTAYTPQEGYANNWDSTQYVPADQPTPRPGEMPWPQPGGTPATWREPSVPSAGGATMLLGPKTEPAFAWLVVVAAPPGSRQVGLPMPVSMTAPTTIGRVPGNTIVLQDSACSSQHAKIRYEAIEEGAQSFVIYDLASSNGLFVGSKEDYKDEKSRTYRKVLEDGDYLLIGESTLVFKKI